VAGYREWMGRNTKLQSTCGTYAWMGQADIQTELTNKRIATSVYKQASMQRKAN